MTFSVSNQEEDFFYLNTRLTLFSSSFSVVLHMGYLKLRDFGEFDYVVSLAELDKKISVTGTSVG